MAASTPTHRGIFLGYLAKKPWPPLGSWDPEGKTGVSEVCSVSDCMCKRRPDWVDRWDFNRATCYETPNAAREAVPQEERDAVAVFAYWLIPDAGADGNPAELPFEERLPPLPEVAGPGDFEQLGYDIVGLKPNLPPFEHSPLSCNYLAMEEPVNRWCLVDEVERARTLAARWSVSETAPEPGTYYVVRVARERAELPASIAPGDG
jgi:hypothetical protein